MFGRGPLRHGAGPPAERCRLFGLDPRPPAHFGAFLSAHTWSQRGEKNARLMRSHTHFVTRQHV